VQLIVARKMRRQLLVKHRNWQLYLPASVPNVLVGNNTSAGSSAGGSGMCWLGKSATTAAAHFVSSSNHGYIKMFLKGIREAVAGSVVEKLHLNSEPYVSITEMRDALGNTRKLKC